MAKKDKKSTLQRQWEMMRILPASRSDSIASGNWQKASEIKVKLNAKGYEVSVRTVQRDLNELAEIFPIELNDKNPQDYGWRWIKGANLDIPGMSVPEALAMSLVETQMKQFLPVSMLEGLQGVFSQAQSKLYKAEKFNNNHSKDWLNKVRVVAPTQPMLPPEVNHEIQANIYQALFDSKQIKAVYKPIGNDKSKEYLLHPLGLILRGGVSYLVASAWEYNELRLYALHRFNSVESLSEMVITPQGFKLDKAIAAGLAEFANQGEPIQLDIRCSASAANHLFETPLSNDQTIETDVDGWSRLTASVNDTWQLHWWLLGQGAEVEVCSPSHLRQAIKLQHLNAVNNYYKGVKNE